MTAQSVGHRRSCIDACGIPVATHSGSYFADDLGALRRAVRRATTSEAALRRRAAPRPAAEAPPETFGLRVRGLLHGASVVCAASSWGAGPILSTMLADICRSFGRTNGKYWPEFGRTHGHTSARVCQNRPPSGRLHRSVPRQHYFGISIRRRGFWSFRGFAGFPETGDFRGHLA